MVAAVWQIAHDNLAIMGSGVARFVNITINFVRLGNVYVGGGSNRVENDVVRIVQTAYERQHRRIHISIGLYERNGALSWLGNEQVAIRCHRNKPRAGDACLNLNL